MTHGYFDSKWQFAFHFHRTEAKLIFPLSRWIGFPGLAIGNLYLLENWKTVLAAFRFRRAFRFFLDGLGFAQGKNSKV
jgi:hypothetical protein